MRREWIAVVLACASTGVFAQAEVLRDSNVSSGQLAFVPYYLAIGNTKTRVTLRNVGPTGGYAFRLDEARNNRIVATESVDPADFGVFQPNFGNINLYMEANSSVTYEIVEEGSNLLLRKVSQSGDVCTVPTISARGAILRNDNWSGSFSDLRGTELQRARQGTIFAIPTSMFTPAVASLIETGDCAAITARWVSGAWASNPSDNLVPARSLRISAEVSIENPAWRARVPTAYLLDFFSSSSAGALHTGPGSTIPGLANANQSTLGQVSVQTPTGTILQFVAGNVDAFAAYLQTFRSFANRYTIGVDAASNTVSDVVVVSQPVKRFYTDGMIRAPYTLNAQSASYSGEPIIACTAPPTPAGQPICQPGSPALVAPLALGDAVTALRLIDTTAPAVSAPFTPARSDFLNVPATYANTSNGPATAIGFDFGPSTGTFGSPNRILTGSGGTQLIGLPTYTFVLRRQLLTPSIVTPGEVIANSQGASGDRAGTSTDSAGKLLVVGAPDADGGKGEVYVFTAPAVDAQPGATGNALAARNLVLIATLRNSAATIGDKFGQRVAISPDEGTIAIGSPLRGSGSGEVAIFRRLTGTWTSTTVPFETLDAPASGLGPTQEFGAALAFAPNGDLAVGAPGSDAGATDAGLAFVFDGGTGSFDDTPPQTLTPSVGQTSARFGTALDAGDDRVAVGAPGQDVDGRVFVYRGILAAKSSPHVEILGPRNASKVAKDIGDKFNFGAAVSIQGPVMVVTAPGEDAGNSADAGRATVFIENESASLAVADLEPTTSAEETAGTSVTLSDEFIAIGSALADRGGKPNSGTSYLFDAPDSGWTSLRNDALAGRVRTSTPLLEIKPFAGEDEQRFGNDLVIAGRAIVVGAPGRTVVTATSQLPLQGEVETFVIDRILKSGFE